MGHRRSAWQHARSSSSGAKYGNSYIFLTKYTVPRKIKPEILKLTIRGGQSNFSIAFIFVTCEGRSYYRVVSVGQLSFDWRSYCGLSRRM